MTARHFDTCAQRRGVINTLPRLRAQLRRQLGQAVGGGGVDGRSAADQRRRDLFRRPVRPVRGLLLPACAVAWRFGVTIYIKIEIVIHI